MDWVSGEDATSISVELTPHVNWWNLIKRFGFPRPIFPKEGSVGGFTLSSQRRRGREPKVGTEDVISASRDKITKHTLRELTSKLGDSRALNNAVIEIITACTA